MSDRPAATHPVDEVLFNEVKVGTPRRALVDTGLEEGAVAPESRR